MDSETNLMTQMGGLPLKCTNLKLKPTDGNAQDGHPQTVRWIIQLLKLFVLILHLLQKA